MSINSELDNAGQVELFWKITFRKYSTQGIRSWLYNSGFPQNTTCIYIYLKWLHFKCILSTVWIYLVCVGFMSYWIVVSAKLWHVSSMFEDYKKMTQWQYTNLWYHWCPRSRIVNGVKWDTRPADPELDKGGNSPVSPGSSILGTSTWGVTKLTKSDKNNRQRLSSWGYLAGVI